MQGMRYIYFQAIWIKEYKRFWNDNFESKTSHGTISNEKQRLILEVGYFCLKTWESLRTQRLLAIGKSSNKRRWRMRRWAGRGRATSRRCVSLSPSGVEIGCNIWKTKTLILKKNYQLSLWNSPLRREWISLITLNNI